MWQKYGFVVMSQVCENRKQGDFVQPDLTVRAIRRSTDPLFFQDVPCKLAVNVWNFMQDFLDGKQLIHENSSKMRAPLESQFLHPWSAEENRPSLTTPSKIHLHGKILQYQGSNFHHLPSFDTDDLLSEIHTSGISLALPLFAASLEVMWKVFQQLPQLGPQEGFPEKIFTEENMPKETWHRSTSSWIKNRSLSQNVSHFGVIVSCEAAVFVVNTGVWSGNHLFPSAGFGNPEFAVMEPWNVVLHCVMFWKRNHVGEGIKIRWFLSTTWEPIRERCRS